VREDPGEVLVEVETFRAVDRERLVGNLDDAETAVKRKELTELLAMLDLAAVDAAVLERARSPFAVNVRALDAVHVATAEVLAGESGGEGVEFWTHDERQATAALSRGLTVRGAGIDREDPKP
jgi:predicted nucleic acid-binding protein